MNAATLAQGAPCMLHVGDTAISEAEIAREMQHHRADTPQASRAAAARALIVRELLRLEAARLGIAAQAEALNGETAEESCIRTLLERELTPRIPDEAACLRYFEQNRERFRTPDSIRLRHILLSAAPDDVNGRLRTRTQGEQLIAELRERPELFADFAHRHSACPSKDLGGDLGWLQPGQATPEFDRQVFRLEVGLAGFPVESRWGYHVVSVDEAQAGAPQSFEEVKARIADYLELQVHQRELQHYLQSLQERYGVRGLEHFS